MVLRDKTAIVTGGAQGIGRAIARELADSGANVIITDVDTAGETTAASIRNDGNEAMFVQADVRNSSSVGDVIEAAVDSFGTLDVVVNNAGGSFADDKVHAVSDETFETVVDVNLKGTFNCTRAAIGPMIDTGGGTFVHIASVNGLRGVGLATYSAAKAGILGLSRTVAAQYGRHEVRSNCLVPGTIVTPENSSKFEDNPEYRATWEDQYPVGRLGTPEDVAEAAIFLADEDRAGFITGIELPVDGGFTGCGVDQTFETEIFGTNERPTEESS